MISFVTRYGRFSPVIVPVSLRSINDSSVDGRRHLGGSFSAVGETEKKSSVDARDCVGPSVGVRLTRTIVVIRRLGLAG